MQALTEYERQTAQQDPSVFLGRLIWYSVLDAMIPHAEVVAQLKAVGIKRMIPPPPKDFDIFRRVSSNADRTKVIPTHQGWWPIPPNTMEHENYLIRPVAGRGENIIIRHIVCERVNPKAKKLTYNAELRAIEFNKATSKITFRDLEPHAALNPNVRSISDEITHEFNAQKGKLNAYAIRELIRKQVLSFNATCVRESGGVYFVQEERAAEVQALGEFVDALPGNALFHSLPLIDDEKQRAMVRRAFEAETCDTIDRTMEEISEILRTGKNISAEKYGKMLAQYQEVVQRTKQYGDLLEVSLDETRSRVGLYSQQMRRLNSNVKSEEE